MGPETEGEGVRVGITAFAQDALGDVVFVSLPEVGDRSRPAPPAARSSRPSPSATCTRRSRARSPPSTRLSTPPELINTDPYGEGWMFEVRIADAAVLDDCSTSTLRAYDTDPPGLTLPARMPGRAS